MYSYFTLCIAATKKIKLIFFFIFRPFDFILVAKLFSRTCWCVEKNIRGIVYVVSNARSDHVIGVSQNLAKLATLFCFLLGFTLGMCDVDLFFFSS